MYFDPLISFLGIEGNKKSGKDLPIKVTLSHYL